MRVARESTRILRLSILAAPLDVGLTALGFRSAGGAVLVVFSTVTHLIIHQGGADNADLSEIQPDADTKLLFSTYLSKSCMASHVRFVGSYILLASANTLSPWTRHSHHPSALHLVLLCWTSLQRQFIICSAASQPLAVSGVASCAR